MSVASAGITIIYNYLVRTWNECKRVVGTSATASVHTCMANCAVRHIGWTQTTISISANCRRRLCRNVFDEKWLSAEWLPWRPPPPFTWSSCFQRTFSPSVASHCLALSVYFIDPFQRARWPYLQEYSCFMDSYKMVKKKLFSITYSIFMACKKTCPCFRSPYYWAKTTCN